MTPQIQHRGGAVRAESWYASSVDWWPAIAEQLTATGKPWPREAQLQDLRWWADAERRGVAERPGRPTLAERWNTTDHAVRMCLKSEDWVSPLSKHGSQKPPAGRVLKLASRSPANRQRRASEPPAAGPANANNQDDPASRSPANRQPLASESPRARAPQSRQRERSETSPPTPAPRERGHDPGELGDDHGPLVLAIERLFVGQAPPQHVQVAIRGRNEATAKDVRNRLRKANLLPVGVKLREIADAAPVALARWLVRPPPPPTRDVPAAAPPSPPPPPIDPAVQGAWDRFLTALGDHIRAEDIDIWFRDARPAWAGQRFELQAANAMYGQWIEDNYLAGLRLAARAAFATNDVTVTWEGK